MLQQTHQERAVEAPRQVNRSRIESKLLGVAIRSLRDDRRSGSLGRFEVTTAMDEVSLQRGRMDLRYTMRVRTTGGTQEAEFRGEASVWLPFIDSQKELENSDDGMINDVAMEIYRSNYETLYLLSRTLGLEPPIPGLVEDVHIVT